MTPEKAKKQLGKMLRCFTPGSVLMMIGEVFVEWSEEARREGSEINADNYEQAEATMVVVGFCLDSILPKPEMR